MADWYLYAHDLARGLYSAVSSSPDSADLSAKNAVDGDPSSLWTPGAASTWTLNIGGAYTVYGYAIANHNLLGLTITFQKFVSPNWLTIDGPRTVVTMRDFLVDVGASLSGTQWRLVVAGSVTGGPKAGVISILTDYGYSEAGVLTSGSGYGKLRLGDGVAGVLYPIEGRVNPGISYLESGDGFLQAQKTSNGYEELMLQLDGLSAAEGGAFWKILNSFFPRHTEDAYTNAAWAKGAWLTDDSWSLAANPSARYVVGAPGAGLPWRVERPGGKAKATLALRTKAHGG